VGPKTADCLLLWSFNKPILPIDINVYKVSKQLGLVPEKANRETVRVIMEELLNHDIKLFKKAHTYLLALGKFYCKATPMCDECPVNQWCKYFSKHQKGK
jgi:endonuclease III